ncbi:MAG: ABC-F family ATP-binding cassette domain-containing protein [Ignavibacteriae bacterium]|nr:ABC-F family ATP-binding cassette domain-containing protein [Ignavibacteriota bacterium]
MLSLNSISIQFGGRSLFDDVSFMIGPHDRIGFVGSNGAGKSTLLKIIAGINEADSGSVDKAKYVTVGYLPQDGVIASGKTLYKEVETAFEDVMFVQQELEEAQQQLSTLNPESEEYADVLEVFGELQHKLEDLDAFRMKSKIERVLMGLGFSVPDFERQTEEFSGGWQMRIALAKLLLKEPSVLLLDEPTNHLDLDSLQWLEEYLHNYNGAIILVSHDRAFLDSITTKTIAISLGNVDTYAGNYSFYEKEKAVRKELQVSAFKNQQQQMKQTQQFIERFRYKATKARQVQSRIKQLEKIELVEIEDEEEEIHFHFPQPKPSGAIVMELKSINKSYGQKKVFHGLNYTLERGDRIAIVGVNGAGKSTFSRIVAGVEPFDSGERKLGYNAILSYFAQHQAEELDMSKEVLQIVDEVAEGEIRTKLRTILGSFLFHDDDVFKKVSVLSGGEKSRLALAKMLLQPANFLIMDEPTNHLDMRSKKVLQEALLAYEGTYIIVSHDRAFLDPIVNKVLEFSLSGARTYLGNVSEYLERKKLERESVMESKGARVQGRAGESLNARSGDSRITNHESPMTEKERKRLEAEARQELYKKTKEHKDRLVKVEKEIEKMEQRKAEIETMMADVEFYKKGEEAKKVAQEHRELKVKLDDAFLEWAEISEMIEKIKNE